ncbi:MAG TPA: glycosyltransferase, partial [Gemmataceae bacterium]|nr:glycosyltransferase [Gemmataceae bacterium]
MPSSTTWELLKQAGRVLPMALRLARRHFAPLVNAPKIQGRFGESRRLLLRTLGHDAEGLAYEANDWLMRTMAHECRRPGVTAVHAYEDCSLWSFEAAKHLGRACIYDMPIGYYPAWEQTQAELIRCFADWLPAGGVPSSRLVRPQQKRREMDLADLVLVPGSFVEKTIRAFHPEKVIARAAYGVDLDFWKPGPQRQAQGPLRFIYAGQISLRKGIPGLLDAWEKAALAEAELELVGLWQLSDSKQRSLPRGVICRPPCSPEGLRDRYCSADVFVFPSYFEGFGLVLLEAMACGLPAIASDATAGPDILTQECGHIVPTGNVDALVDSLRWFYDNSYRLPALRRAARVQAEAHTWARYR